MLPGAAGVGVVPLGRVYEDAVLGWEGRKMLSNVIPVRFARQTAAFAPPLGRVQAPAPVGEIEDGVARDALFARRHRRGQRVEAGGDIECRIVGDMFRCAEHDLPPPVQRALGRAQTVLQFGEEDRMRLFPEQNLIADPGRAAPLRPDRLRPLQAAIPNCVASARAVGRKRW